MNSSRARKQANQFSEIDYLYLQRLEIVKQGTISQKNGDYNNAVSYYKRYLEIISRYKSIEIGQLHPAIFNQKTEQMEIMLLCSIYWEMAKMYDKMPLLKKEFLTSLEQFKIFTIGYPYQNANIEAINRFIRSNKLNHKEDFKAVYKKMYIHSQQCYIATHCFGRFHPVTHTLRNLKQTLLHYPWGEVLIALYYRYSPKIVLFLEHCPVLNFFITQCLMKPLLCLVAFIYKIRYK